MRYSGSEKLEIIRLVEQPTLSVCHTLASIGIPRSTFYGWYSRYQDGGRLWRTRRVIQQPSIAPETAHPTPRVLHHARLTFGRDDLHMLRQKLTGSGLDEKSGCFRPHYYRQRVSKIDAGNASQGDVMTGTAPLRFYDWRNRIRDPSLTVLLIIQLGVLFIAEPLAAQGIPMAQELGEALLSAGLVIVVLLSYNFGAIVMILLGLVATFASSVFQAKLPLVAASALDHGGKILLFSALTWVVGRSVFAPGRITFHRFQGAVVLYLNLATMFASAFSFLWELDPANFSHFVAHKHTVEDPTMLYFSLATLTTIGYGDISPVQPFARSLANLEAVAGHFYLAITVARLVTLDLENRRRLP
jgi:hypothetical protein